MADCDDNDATVNPSATETWYDGVDSDCDGWSDYDADGDGEDATANMGTDCDDTDAELNTADNDADGTTSCDGDCDDWDAAFNLVDADTDGVTTCDGDCDDNDTSVLATDADGDGYLACGPGDDLDCDDSDATAFPGNVAADFPDECLVAANYDADGDGYAAQIDDCFELTLTDSWGDGWNGGFLLIFENGTLVPSGQSEYTYSYYMGDIIAPADSFYVESGSSSASHTFCISTPAVLELVYSSGAYDSEVSFVLATSTGAELINTSSPSGFDYWAFYAGTDSDDTDATVQ